MTISAANYTLYQDHETGGTGGTPTYASVGSGQGAVQDGDQFLIGVDASGRRRDDATYPEGFWFISTSDDLSVTDGHLCVWFWSVTPAQLNDFGIRIGSGLTDYEEHNPGSGFFPETGGWVPIWFPIGDGTDTGTPDFAAVTHVAILVGMGNITANLKNMHTDQTGFATRPVLVWTGAAGDLDDFVTHDEANRRGVLILKDGIYFCYANLGIGTSTSTGFDFDGKVIVFPEGLSAVSGGTFYGLDIDLQNASTVITGIGASIIAGNPAAAAERLPDFLVTGTSGSLDITNAVFLGLRLADLNAAVTADGCSFAECGRIDAAGASLVGALIVDTKAPANDSALVWDVNEDPDGELDEMTIPMGATSTHAIEFGLTSPLTMTLRGLTLDGYGATDDANDSHFHVKRTSGTVTINLVDTTTDAANFSVRSDGATVVIVEDPVTLTIHAVRLDTGADRNGSRVLVTVVDPGPNPFEDSVTIVQSGGTATVTHTGHGLIDGDKVLIDGAANDEDYNGVKTITVTGPNDYTYSIGSGVPSPATGTIIATLVLIDGVTAGSGTIADTRTYSGDQDFEGRIRDSTSPSPFFKTARILAQTLAGDKTVDVGLIRDD